MTFTIVERKVKIPEETREYAVRKIEKLDRYFHKDSKATVTFSAERGRQTVEVTVVHGGIVFRAEETTTDMYASIDGVVSSIERQIRKNKTRLEKPLREGAFEREILSEPTEGIVEEDYEVIRHKRFSVKPMSPEEAILQMNLLGHQFFMFIDAVNSNRHSVIYKRTSGGYGFIDSEN